MLGLRTDWGLNLNEMRKRFGDDIVDQIIDRCRNEIESKYRELNGEQLVLTEAGRMIADSITLKLFLDD